MTDCNVDAFVVRFREALAECFSEDDAAALASARDLLTDLLGYEPTLEECDELCGGDVPFRRLDAGGGVPFQPFENFAGCPAPAGV